MSILAWMISFHFKMRPWMELVDCLAALAAPVDEQEGLLHSLPASFVCGLAKGEVRVVELRGALFSPVTDPPVDSGYLDSSGL